MVTAVPAGSGIARICTFKSSKGFPKKKKKFSLTALTSISARIRYLIALLVNGQAWEEFASVWHTC